MSKNSIAIATMTWARDEAEEKLLRESLQELAKLDLPVYITDGGSGEAFLDFLRSFSNFNLLEPNGSGVWPQVRNSLAGAFKAGHAFILYTEPDKHDFFKLGLPAMLPQLLMDDQSGIILAGRSKAGFESYPAFQRMTETTINNCCAEITGNAIDYTYGPFIMNRLLVPYLEQLKDNIGWGWRLYVFVIANRLRYRLEAFDGDFYCQEGQNIDNATERIYRMRQLVQSIDAIVISASVEV